MPNNSGGTHKDKLQEAHLSRPTQPQETFCIRREAMKKSLIIGAALVACMVVLTLMSGLAQAQSPSSRTVGVEEDEGKVQEVTEERITPQFVDPTRFFTGDCTIG